MLCRGIFRSQRNPEPVGRLGGHYMNHIQYGTCLPELTYDDVRVQSTPDRCVLSITEYDSILRKQSVVQTRFLPYDMVHIIYHKIYRGKVYGPQAILYSRVLK